MPFAPIAKILITTKSIPKQQQDQKKKQKTPLLTLHRVTKAQKMPPSSPAFPRCVAAWIVTTVIKW